MTISIAVEDARWERIGDLDQLVETAAKAALPFGETRDIALLFTTDAEIKVLNNQWRHKDGATNVLSFPSGPMPGLPDGEAAPLGDVVLAYETIMAEAAASGKPERDHISHLIVHGILHLLGYDHIDDDDATMMEQLERDILAGLGIPDPYTP